MGSSNTTSYFGNVINPWKVEGTKLILFRWVFRRVMAAVVVFQSWQLLVVILRSIRQPAAFTGLVGVKPTWQMFKVWGMVALLVH